MELLPKASELQLCPCYKECQEFQKLVELKDHGLVIYCHRPTTDNIRQGEAVAGAVSTSSDVFILHNKKDVKVTTSQLTSELEKGNISCPRCRKRFQHVQELMKELKSIDKRNVMSICDHCRKRALKKPISKKPLCACEKIVELFKTVKGEQTEGTINYVTMLPSNKGQQRKDPPKKIRAFSDLQINPDIIMKSPAPGHEPEVQQMFYSNTHYQSDDTDMSESDIKEDYIKQAIAFIEPKPMETAVASLPHDGKKINTTMPGIPLIGSLGSVTTFVEPYVAVKELPRPSIKDRNQNEVFEDIPSINAKEELKRRHDLSLRQMLKHEKDFGVPNSISKRPDVYETPKTAAWGEKQPIPKYQVESETEIKKISKKTKYELGSSDSDNISNKSSKFGSLRTKKNLQDSDIEPSKLDKERDQMNKGSEEQAKNVKKLEDTYFVTNIKLGRNVSKVKKLEQRVSKSNSRRMTSLPQFSYIFPKVKEKQEKHISVKSSQLIKDAQEKYKKRKEQERQAQREKKQPGREARKVQDGEKLIYMDDQQMLPQRDKSKEIILGNAEVAKLKVEGAMKGENQKKLQRDKQIEKDKFKEEKEKKSIKKKQGLSNDIKTSSSNIYKSISAEHEIEEKASKKKKKGDVSTKKEAPNYRKKNQEFEILQAERAKAKAEAQKQKLLLDAEKTKQDAGRKESKVKKRRIQQARSTDYVKLVKIKQASKKTPSDLYNEFLKDHMAHHKRGQKVSFCPLCLDSDLELELMSLINYERDKKDKINHIIIGEKIYRHIPGLEKINKPEGVVPIFFQKDVSLESEFKEKVELLPKEVVEGVHKKKLATDVSKKDEVATESLGIIRYALSDRKFIDKGWTVLPTEKVVRMMNVYRMRPARPEFDWFKHNKNKRLMTYDTGERLAEFDDNGRGRWYYRNGRLALDYYDAEETNAQQRFVVYSSGEPDERGRTHPITILATFDYLGNGIVLDHAGKIRLKYNQTEGVVLDRSIGPVSHWKWHTLNDPPVLQQVMIDTQVAHKDPDILKFGSSSNVAKRPDNEEMLAIEFDNFIKEKTKKLSQKLVPFQIKMKALKINEHFSLKVLDQATVYLIFRDGLTNLKINMGMILDEKEIVDTDTAEVGEVSNNLERFPARTDSIASMQRSVAYARCYERQRAERERRLRPPEPCASADIMTAAVSMPMRVPITTVPTGMSSVTRCCSRKSSNNLYYDTRLLC